MFILDSLFISGFRWVLDTVTTAAEAEMNDDTALREELLTAEMRREVGEISDDEFADIEADLLARIREIKARREGDSGPITMGKQPMHTSSDTRFAVEANVAGDFHEPAAEPVAFEHHPVTVGEDHGTVIEGTLTEPAKPRKRRSPPRTSGASGTRTTGTQRTRSQISRSRTSRSSRTARKIR
jgi:hypothetical protein